MVRFNRFTSVALSIILLSSSSCAFTTPKTAFTKVSTRRNMVDPLLSLADLVHSSLTLASDTTANTEVDGVKNVLETISNTPHPTTSVVASLMGAVTDSINLPPVEAMKETVVSATPPPPPPPVVTPPPPVVTPPPPPPAVVVQKAAEVVKAATPPPPPPVEVIKASAPKVAEVVKATPPPPPPAVVTQAAPAVTKAVAKSATDVSTSGPSGSYSKVSYYTTLALYAASFPGLWSQIKRSTSAKMKQKTYVSPGANSFDGKTQREQAGEIMAYMKANNYEVQDAGEVITFRGIVQRSTSQAFFLVFCTALGMASLALVLQIQFQDLVLPVIGKPNWFYLTLLSPYAGLYYWKSGDRVDDIKVKLVTNDEETENEIVVEGNDEEIERMWRTLKWTEKGMVKVEGIF